MVTSGTTTYNPVRNVIVYAALRIVGAYAASNQPRPEQVADAVEALEMMLKGWQMEGFLWLKQFIYITLVAGQKSYQIGPTSTDLVHTDVAATTDYLQRPTRLYDPSRRNVDGYEVPITPLSRNEYTNISSKSNPGVVTQVYYDPQLDNGVLYVWNTPVTGVTDKIVASVDRVIEDVGSDEKTLYIPPEFIEATKYSLALRLSSEYPPGMSDSDKKLATSLYDKMVGYQYENVSVFFQPGR